MTVNPYASPSAQVADPVEPAVPRPRRVTAAIGLVCMALAVGMAVTIVQHRDRFVGETFLVISLSIGLVAGLCFAIGARRNWARWVMCAFILLPWLGNIRVIAGWLRPPLIATQIIVLGADAMSLFALILLFTGPSNRWFKQPRPRG